MVNKAEALIPPSSMLHELLLGIVIAYAWPYTSGSAGHILVLPAPTGQVTLALVADSSMTYEPGELTGGQATMARTLPADS